MKHEYSLNNHYKWGFNDQWFNKPEAEGWFNVSIGACTRPHGTFRDECINTAKLLGERITKPILVGLSGGSDSQVVCLSLMQAGVPFTPVILRLVSSKGRLYNRFDIEGAFEFCRKHKIIPIIEELDLDNYYCTQLFPLVQDYCITSAEISVQLHLVRKYKDTHAYINGGGDPILLKKTDEETGETYIAYELGPTPIEQYMMDHDIEGCLKFFMYTPEQIAAFLDHPVMHYYNGARDAIRDGASYMYFTYCIKAMMYANEWPELVKRKKYTGFEGYPYLNVVRKLIYKMNDHINPKAKMVKWKYEEILAHLNSCTGEVKSWRSIDETNYYG